MNFGNLESLDDSIHSIGTSLEEIESCAKHWVMLPVESSQGTDDFDVNSVSISRFSNAFRCFESSANAKDLTDSYSSLVALRTQVSESKKRLSHLKDNKATVGPAEVLKEAVNLKMLIPKLRSAETDFVFKFMNNWRESLSKMCVELQQFTTN